MSVQLVFYRIKLDKLSFLDRILTLIVHFISDWYIFSRPYTHVELVLQERYPVKISYGITDRDKIIHEITDKEYFNEDYEPPTVLALTPSMLDFISIKSFVNRTIKEKHGFDRRYWMYFIPIIGRCIPQQTNAWFCSKFVATAIKETHEARYFKGYVDPERLTPQALYDLCISTCLFIHSGPSDVRPLV